MQSHYHRVRQVEPCHRFDELAMCPSRAIELFALCVTNNYYNVITQPRHDSSFGTYRQRTLFKHIYTECRSHLYVCVDYGWKQLMGFVFTICVPDKHGQLRRHFWVLSRTP